jgi:predicted ATPase
MTFGQSLFPIILQYNRLSLCHENAAWIAEICRHLDGMPLAIEVAAARVRAFSVQQIAQRLDDHFHLLTSGGHIAPLRHQTLAATLDWS